MVKFGKDKFTYNFEDWTKHHKTIGILIKRIYQNGTTNLVENPLLVEIAEKYKDELKSKSVTLYNRNDDEMTKAEDYYLQLDNLEYIEPDIEYYSIGSANTQLKLHIRAKFLLEDCLFIMERSYKTGGSYAMSFTDFTDNDFVENLISEVKERNLTIDKDGISVQDDEDNILDGDFRINVIDKNGIPITIEVEKRELVQACIGIELYKFELEID